MEADPAQIKIVLIPKPDPRRYSFKQMTLDYLLGKSSQNKRGYFQYLINTFKNSTSTLANISGDNSSSTIIYAYKVYRYLCASCAKIFQSKNRFQNDQLLEVMIIEESLINLIKSHSSVGN